MVYSPVNQLNAGGPLCLAAILIELVDLTLPLRSLGRCLPRHHVLHPILRRRVRNISRFEQSCDTRQFTMITRQNPPESAFWLRRPPVTFSQTKLQSSMSITITYQPSNSSSQDSKDS